MILPERGDCMKDFPMFTTEYGVASLILKEVPYRKEAYIVIQSSQQPEELLTECISFCRIVGAEKIYARGHEYLERFPLHCAIYEMKGVSRVNDELVQNLWPVTTENIEKWRGMLNERMSGVDNAGTLERGDEKEILSLGGAYFVHNTGELLGAGWVADGELKLIASFKKGAGERVIHSLLSTVPDQFLSIQVVSTNQRAIRLYEQMGFVKCAELRRWYCVKNTENN